MNLTSFNSVSYFQNLLTLDVNESINSKNYLIDIYNSNFVSHYEPSIITSNIYFQELFLIDINKLKTIQINYFLNLLHNNTIFCDQSFDIQDILTLDNYKLFNHDITSNSDLSELTEETSIFKQNDIIFQILKKKSLMKFIEKNFIIQRKVLTGNLKGYFFEDDYFLNDDQFASAFLIGIDPTSKIDKIEEYFKNEFNLIVYNVIVNPNEQTSIVRVVYISSKECTLSKPRNLILENKLVLLIPIIKECRPELIYMNLQVVVLNLPNTVIHNYFVKFINENFGKFFTNQGDVFEITFLTNINSAVISFTNSDSAQLCTRTKSFNYLNKQIILSRATNPFKIKGKYININNEDTLESFHIPINTLSQTIKCEEKYKPSFRTLCKFSIKLVSNDALWESFLIAGKSDEKYEIENFLEKIEKFYSEYKKLYKHDDLNKKNQGSRRAKNKNPPHFKEQIVNEFHESKF